VTPAETARQEAARQAVALAFGIAGVLLLIVIQRKLGGSVFDAMQAEHDRADPSGAARRRMQAALTAARRWDRAATVLFRVGPRASFWWAMDRAERARAAYEAERG